MHVEGPWGSVRVDRDSLGYPTIHARDLHEATWVRGYLHATDRLVQVQLMLAAARGELLSMFGEKRFARTVDRAVRGLGLVTDLDTQVRKLQPETRAWFETYSNGFNAGAAKRGTPSILRLLGRKVEVFTPKSVLTIYRLVAFFGLTSMQQTAEMIVAELVASGAPREAFTTLLGDASEAPRSREPERAARARRGGAARRLAGGRLERLRHRRQRLGIEERAADG